MKKDASDRSQVSRTNAFRRFFCQKLKKPQYIYTIYTLSLFPLSYSSLFIIITMFLRYNIEKEGIFAGLVGFLAVYYRNITEIEKVR